MTEKRTITVPVNRVEGDLKLTADIENSHVTDAWCSGTMYRGFEQMMAGRGALDGLVITPRVCGICGTAHLTAAARALDMILGVTLPPDAIRIRNIALMVEHLQNDLRHSFLMFTPDFTNKIYATSPLYDEAVRRYRPFAGETVLEVVRRTKSIIEIIAIVGGQWPHSSFMVPGGVVYGPTQSNIVQCRLLLAEFKNWYESRILGCSIDRFLKVQSADQLDEWIGESPTHKNSDLGFFIRFAREIGLDNIGRSWDTFLSFGALDLPENTGVCKASMQQFFAPAGFIKAGQSFEFDQNEIMEHVAYSWFQDYAGGKHPSKGVTEPYASGAGQGKYSWAKAPRYMGAPAETGPLAEMVVGKNPLFLDLVSQYGGSVFVRQLARILRCCDLIPAMDIWLSEIKEGAEIYTSPAKLTQGEGFGLTHASRGILGHWLRVEDSRITKYQIITPTTWHASPRDSNGKRGPMEEALVGTPVKDPDNPVELGHVIRSFDPCMVCTVHALCGGKSTGTRLAAGPAGDSRN